MPIFLNPICLDTVCLHKSLNQNHCLIQYIDNCQWALSFFFIISIFQNNSGHLNCSKTPSYFYFLSTIQFSFVIDNVFFLCLISLLYCDTYILPIIMFGYKKNFSISIIFPGIFSEIYILK